jgi:hypothetical protein
MSPRPLILLEFNELSPPLMDKFIKDGLLPNFAKLRSEASTYVTDAGEDPPNLNPWIQWVTLHSGQSYAEHGVFHLGDAATRKVPMIWDQVCAAGHDSWVCGSMNIAVQPGFKGWVLPDPWDATTASRPEEFDTYMKLVRAYVFEHTSGKRPVTLGAIAKFLLFMLRNGLKAGTVLRILRQLVDERFNDSSWKRASILDLLQFDLFRSVYKRNKPLLSTLFFNSTAHYQHAFWRNMQPEVFKIKPSAAEQKSKANAVLFGYQEMDRLLGKVFSMAGPDTVIAFATALSQQPCLSWEGDGGKTFYKPHDVRKLLEFLGIDPAGCRIEPVMSEQFHLRFTSDEAAAKAKSMLDAARTDAGGAVFSSRLEGHSVFTGCSIFGDLPGGTRLSAGAREAVFTDLFYQIEAIKSGMHHRDGLLWIRTPERRAQQHPQKLPLTAVKSELLKSMGLPDIRERALSDSRPQPLRAAV